MQLIIELTPLNMILLSILAIVCTLNVLLILLLVTVLPFVTVLWLSRGLRLAFVKLRLVLIPAILVLGAITNKTLRLLAPSLLTTVPMADRVKGCRSRRLTVLCAPKLLFLSTRQVGTARPVSDLLFALLRAANAVLPLPSRVVVLSCPQFKL